MSSERAFHKVAYRKKSVWSLKTVLKHIGGPKDGKPTQSWDNCRHRYPREEDQFSVQPCQSLSKAIFYPLAYRTVLAERTSLAAWSRITAEQIRIAEGTIRQRVLRKILLGASEFARLRS